MDAFNFAFSLFAIILGLSLVEVLTGFARALKRRRVVHLGWLTPLAAIFVMLDLTGFWESSWGSRRFVSPQYGYLLIGLFVSALYYLAASVIFPSEFGERADFDAHYMQHRRPSVRRHRDLRPDPDGADPDHPLQRDPRAGVGRERAAIVGARDLHRLAQQARQHRRAGGADRDLFVHGGDELRVAGAVVTD